MTFGSYSTKLTVEPICSKAKDVAVNEKNAAKQINNFISILFINISKLHIIYYALYST